MSCDAADALSLRGLVPQLDALLTGKSGLETARTAASQAHLLDPESFLSMSDAYYLSDGGYSRIRVDQESGRLFLGGTSRAQVAARWGEDAVRGLVDGIEAVLRDCLREHGLLDETTLAPSRR